MKLFFLIYGIFHALNTTINLTLVKIGLLDKPYWLIILPLFLHTLIVIIYEYVESLRKNGKIK